MPFSRLKIRSAAVSAVFLAVSAFAMVACGPAKWHETAGKPVVATYTGDPRSERQTTPTQPSDLHPGDHAQVNPSRVCGRRIPNQPCKDSDVVIERGDEVKVKDPKPKEDGTVEVECKKRVNGECPKGSFNVPPKYLNTHPQSEDDGNELAAEDRYFVVQNVATEKLRVYERCDERSAGKGCSHKLVLETSMVVGENTSERRTRLGSFTISRWFKFYEDNQGDYPSFYNPAYPALPADDADPKAWFSPSLLPGHGSVRGAFGWYTAHLEPDADEQWLHGTWGWGADSHRFIDLLHTSSYDHNARLASHGCTRVDNEAIAFLREKLVPGTKLIRIYAREAYGHPGSAAKTAKGSFAWVLTKDGVNQANGPRAGREENEAHGLKASSILREGTYALSADPVAVALSQSDDPHANGNSYSIPAAGFKGYFLVDSGRLADYEHPAMLAVGGHEPHRILPAVLEGGHVAQVAADTPAKK